MRKVIYSSVLHYEKDMPEMGRVVSAPSPRKVSHTSKLPDRMKKLV